MYPVSPNLIAVDEGNGSTFTLTVDSDKNTASGSIGADVKFGSPTFEADTVLCRRDGSGRIAPRPTEGNFKASGAKAKYAFTKSYPKNKPCDIIIRTDTG
jgi:hypothetical protein